MSDLHRADDFRKRALEGDLSDTEADVLVISSSLLNGSTLEQETLGKPGSITRAYEAFHRFLANYNDVVHEVNKHRMRRWAVARPVPGGQLEVEHGTDFKVVKLTKDDETVRLGVDDIPLVEQALFLLRENATQGEEQ